MRKILFLGYNHEQTSLIDKIKFYKKEWHIKQTNKKINLITAKKFESIISFGYRHVIDKHIIDNLGYPIINLHISFLPYNRGTHPNFWSFAENTPSGVSIHETDYGVDTGRIIYQKKLILSYSRIEKILRFLRLMKNLLTK